MPPPAARRRRQPFAVRWRAPMAVLAGGFIGSAGRWAVGALVPSRGFPNGTLIVNLAGSLALGFYLARRERAVASPHSLPFWAIGVLGSFTTFSAFSLEVFELLGAGRPVVAVTYAVASTAGGLAAAMLGDRIGGFGR